MEVLPLNRNVESHFALNPTNIDISRSQFDRSCTIKFSGNAGSIIPFYVDEVLPGDTFQVTSSKVVRLQTLQDPIMDNIYLDTYYFFVPNRIVWDHWKNFCGEPAAAWYDDTEYTIPALVPPATGFGVNSVADYMGIPLTVNDTIKINALPFRAYAKIVDDWFRDENLSDPLVINYGDTDTTGNDTTADDIYCAAGGPCYRAAKYHDYFTSCLPAPQRGSSVSIPITFAGTGKVGIGSESHDGYTKGALSGGLQMTGLPPTQQGDTETSHNLIWNNTSNYWYANDANRGNNYSGPMRPTNLWAEMEPTTQLIDINSLRTAFQIQRFYERSARGGARYVELLKSQFGVTSPDASQQRSEYLGGNRIPLNVHEVLNNSEGDSAFLGNLGAYSATADVNSDFTKSFTEHGYVIGVCVMRYDHTYGQGIERTFLRHTLFDYYWPVFANLGEQAVKTNEIYFDNTATTEEEIAERDASVFGYQEAWADYRYKPSRVAGMMRCEYEAPLSSWHLADDYATSPILSDEWIREDLTNIDRVLQVTSVASNQFFADILVKNICTRAMPMYSIPGLIDHN